MKKLSSAIPFLPVSTIDRLAHGQGLRGAGAGATTDVGRGVGALAGARLAGTAMTHVHTPDSLEAVVALGLAGYGVGGVTGHLAGKALGNQLFHPDRLPSAIDKLRALIHRH